MYVRWIGLLCSAIPMVLFMMLTVFVGSLEGITLAWILATFIPLMFLSYIMDVFYSHVPLISRLRNPPIRIVLSWMLLFPIASFLRDILLYILTRDPALFSPYQVNNLPSLALSLVLLGFVYGVFFAMAYRMSLRWYIRSLQRRQQRG